MKKNLLAALVCTALVTAGCGGSSGGSSITGALDGGITGGGTTDGGTTDGGTTGDGTTGGGTTGTGTTGGTTDGGTTGGTTGTTDGGTVGEDRSRPPSGTVLTSSLSGASVVSNGTTGSAGVGPVVNNINNPNSFPRLALGDFWWVNNAFNFNNTGFTGWTQQITLAGSDGNLVPTVNYDWGAEADLNNEFATSSFPELIFGAKSEFERSGPFSATGLPIENPLLPNEINISYDYQFNQNATSSPTGDIDPQGQPNVDDSGFNVVVESFWHDSCDIERKGEPDDNQIFEMMVWLHIGKRGPSAEGRNGSVGTFTTTDGVTYDVFTKTDAFFRGESGVRNFLAFVAQEETFSGTLPYHEFMNQALNNLDAYGTGWRFLQDTDCFANILLGSEVWYGAASFQWNDVTIEQVY